MLLASINRTVDTVAEVNSLGQLPPEAESIRGRAATFISEVVPKLLAVQLQLASFASAAKDSVAALLTQLDGGRAPALLRPKLEELSLAATNAREQIEALAPILNEYRTGFASDSATLQALKAVYSASRVGLQAAEKHWEEELAKRQTQMTVENVLMWIVPLAKLASEIVSAVQHQNTTEGALAEAKRKRAEIEAQAAQIELMCQRLTAAMEQFGRMAQSVQMLTNLMSTLCGMLRNEAKAFDDADGVAMKLFLLAVAANLEDLALKVA